jgi:LPXTG-motif cell wall-anchored protein
MNDNRRGAIGMSPGGSPKTGARIGWFFVGLGLLLMIVGGGFALKRQQFLSHAAHTQGTVIALSSHTSTRSSGHTYAPIFTFRDQTGKEWTETSSSSTSPASYHVGETVDVYYTSNNPAAAEVNGFFSMWGGSAIVGGIGLVQFLLGLACAKVFGAAARQQGYS